jgi:tetratricopeptide (TPR) repeat protein
VQRPDLVAKHISQLGEVLRRLQAWKQLQVLAEKALTLHQGDSRQLAQDYGFLAEVALEQSNWNEAHQLAQQALQILDRIPNLQPYEQGLYRFVLARSQRRLGQVQEAIANLEQAIEKSKPQYNPELYIGILGELRSLYFEQGEYLAAFRIKQEQLQVEHQYGFRAFIGAGYLLPKQYSVNPALEQVELQGTIAQEIAVSSREQDVKRLKERLSSNEHKLIVIHGQSGVGKSSILQAGLIPTLHQQAIAERDTLPILLRVYTDWVGALGSCLDEGLSSLSRLPLQPLLLRGEQDSDSPLLQGEGLGERSILQQLRHNADRNLLTVLIFDQFEEFFFVYTDPKKRQPFYEFLRVCLDIPFMKVIFSLREDYLHYLLELDRLLNLTVINNNILDKGIRYYLGNFSPDDAESVVQSLTRNSQFPLETGLIEAFVQDLAGEVGEVRPIELQIVGMQLQTEKITTLEQYQQGWTKNKLVEGFLEDVIHDCGAENERAARLVLYLLTNENGTRPLKTRRELAAELGAEANPLDLVLEIFVKSGLVLLLPEKPEYLYQLVHDYLVEFIRQQQGAELLAELKKEKEQRILAEQRFNRFLRLVLFGSVTAVFGLAGLTWEARYQRREVYLADVMRQERYRARERNRLEEHTSRVWSVSFSPDGKTLASGSADKTIKLWEVATGKPITTLTGHTSRVWSVSFSPDGKTLASGSADKTIKLWEVATSKPITTLTGHTSTVNSVSFSPDGKTLASASSDKTIKLWDVATGKLITTLTGHTSRVWSVSFSPDGKTLASGSFDKTIKLWDVATGKLITTLTRHTSPVNSVSFSPDSTTLASASSDKTIKLWNLDLDNLVVRGCDWVRDYLENNPNVSKSDRTLCDGISTQK